MPTDSQFTQFRRKQIAELRPYVHGEKIDHVSVSNEDRKAGSPKLGDMIARNPKNHADQWLVAAAYFADNFEALPAAEQAQEAQPVINVKQLEWSEEREPNEDIRYTHVVAESCLGQWSIEWKSWKDYDDRTIFLDGNFMDNGGYDLDDAKAAAQADYERRILAALEPAEPATDAEPIAWLYDWVDDDGETQTEASTNQISSVNFKPTSNVRPLFTRPPESQLREAAREAVNCITHHAEDNENTRWVLSLLNAALAQEDGR